MRISLLFLFFTSLSFNVYSQNPSDQIIDPSSLDEVLAQIQELLESDDMKSFLDDPQGMPMDFLHMFPDSLMQSDSLNPNTFFNFQQLDFSELSKMFEQFQQFAPIPQQTPNPVEDSNKRKLKRI